MPTLSGQRQHVQADARPGRAGQGAGAHRGATSATSTPRSPRRRRSCLADATSTTTRRRGDRPECCDRRRDAERAHGSSRNTQSVYGPGVVRRAREVLGSKAPPLDRIRVTYYEGGGAFGGRVAVRRRGPGGGAHVGARRQAGPAAVHALGRDGWGNYGPPLLADVRGARRRERQASSASSTRWPRLIPVLRRRRRRSRWLGRDGAIAARAPARSTRR